MAAYFAAGPLETEVIGGEVGKASALKMCFAANTKGATALLCAVAAAAEQLGVRAELERQWSRWEAGAADENERRIRQVTQKAWRFVGEMAQIGDTFEEAGVPDGFLRAAEDVYQRMAGFKDAGESAGVRGRAASGDLTPRPPLHFVERGRKAGSGSPA